MRCLNTTCFCPSCTDNDQQTITQWPQVERDFRKSTSKWNSVSNNQDKSGNNQDKSGNNQVEFGKNQVESGNLSPVPENSWGSFLSTDKETRELYWHTGKVNSFLHIYFFSRWNSLSKQSTVFSLKSALPLTSAPLFFLIMNYKELKKVWDFQRNKC